MSSWNYQNKQTQHWRVSATSLPMVVSESVSDEKDVILDDGEVVENQVRFEEFRQPGHFGSSCDPTSNLSRFLEATKPSVPARYLPVMRIGMSRTRDLELRPYFALRDLWEFFKEWSAYGIGVPLSLNERDIVRQYYVPYLSGLQLYRESTKPHAVNRRPDEDSDVDSSIDVSSDCEIQSGSSYSNEQELDHANSASGLGIDDVCLMDRHTESSESLFSYDSKGGNPEVSPLFEYFERDSPYCRVPLADKVSHLARCFPELKILTSYDLSPASWMSVAWYPIYQIPTGPTLKNLDACFLTFHSLSNASMLPGSTTISHTQGTRNTSEISLPAFGLASYKLNGSVWTPTGGCERRYAHTLQQAADRWLRLRCADHPDYFLPHVVQSADDLLCLLCSGSFCKIHNISSVEKPRTSRSKKSKEKGLWDMTHLRITQQ